MSPINRRCDGVTRRDFVRVGGISALGLGLGSFLKLQSLAGAAGRTDAKAKQCILIWLDGGPTHLETWDPKPDASEEVRGPLGTVGTSVAGIRLSECFQQTAGLMKQLAIVRSVTSPLGEHNFGSHYLLTGNKPSPALAYPTFGATLAHLGNHAGVLPPNIAIPSFSRNVSGNGFLPGSTQPFSVGGEPNRGVFRVRDLDFYQGLDLERLDRRRQFVDALNRFGEGASSPAADTDLERAYNLLASSEARQAFELERETPETRQRYGQGNGIGQSCLLARRLIERGVPFVTVNSSGWDTHQNLVQLRERYPGDRNALLPSLDRGLSALLKDLQDRRMLDETLVVVMGEFGRTPKVNTNGGRDHWPNVFSVLLAGGGVSGGQVIGASDSLGEFPDERPVTPADLAASIYQLLGIDPAHELRTADGRPVRLVADGAQPVRELFS